MIRARFALVLLLAAAAMPLARAQPLPAGDAATSSAGPVEPPPPADPAAAPPPAAVLGDPAAAAPPPAAARPSAAAPLPGLESLPDGAWRLRFAEGSAALTPPATRVLHDLGRRLAAGAPPPGNGRYTVIAQASGPDGDISATRRLSLARGMAVKDALAAGGLADTRIDIRPVGRTEEALDAVDVLPPGVQRDPARPGRPR